MNQPTFNGRPGKRTRQQKLSDTLKRAKAMNNKYGIGGREKTGALAPRKITLAKLNFGGET